MKVALIGLGRWGKVLQGELSKLAEIKYACDSSFDLNQVWNDAEVEAVFIATPTETHFEIAKRALEAGKHVFLEKPGTTSSVDLEKLVNLAEEKKLKFAIGYEFPHHPAAQKLKELIGNSPIDNIFFDWRKWGTFKDDARHHLLCHDVSLLKFFDLETTIVASKATKVISDTDILGTAFVKGSSLINRASPIKHKSVTLSAGGKTYIWSNNDLFEIVGEEMKKIELPDITPVAAELKDFLHSDSPLCNGHFALEVYKVIEQV